MALRIAKSVEVDIVDPEKNLSVIVRENRAGGGDISNRNERLPRQMSWFLIFSDSFYTVER